MQIELPGVRLNVLTDGDSTAPAVVLLHGLGRDAANLAGIAAALTPTHYVLSPDQRGHGESERVEHYGFEYLCGDLLALLDALHIERADLVGHSLGANVAWLFATEHPDRVRKLVALDAVPPRGWQEFEPPEPPGPDDEEPPAHWLMLPPILRQLAQPDPDWWDGLRRITAPALIIGGGRDSHVEQTELAAAADLVPDCTLVTVGGGHHPHTTATDATLAELIPFLVNGK